jgi:hypothetical protein
MCVSCNCTPCTCYQLNSCQADPCDPCTTAQGCPINLSTECVFYNLNSSEATGLTCLNIENGISLKTILEAIDTAICEISPINILAYTVPCITNSYSVTNFQEYIEAVDQELCVLKLTISNNLTTLSNSIAATNTLVNTIFYPSISDCGTLNLEVGDSIIVILQKYADAICNILATCCSDNSPSINATDSSTINFTTSGTKNHNLTAAVKLSSVLGNEIEILPDGLYCSVSIPDYTQVLSFNSGTNTITLSNGGGSITLNPDADAQTLSLNCLTKILTISDGNSVDLTCIAGGGFVETPLVAVDSATIDFTTSGVSGHILTGSVIPAGLISATAGNSIVVSAGGLYSAASADIKVKVNSGDPTSGYLEDKITGKINSLITTTVITNGGTYKSEVESILDVGALLSLIASNPAFLTTLCNMVEGCMCYKFRITNNGGVAELYDYVNCSGASFTGLSLGAGASVDICGRSANTASSDIIIQNLGNC